MCYDDITDPSPSKLLEVNRLEAQLGEEPPVLAGLELLLQQLLALLHGYERLLSVPKHVIVGSLVNFMHCSEMRIAVRNIMGMAIHNTKMC